MAILFIVLYYHIQRAKHRVPPFFKTRNSSSPKGLTFLRSKKSLSPSSPYTLDVRDDDSSNSTSSDQTTSSPIQNRLLSGHYKVTEPPINTTIEELLSSYDNRSTSSSSSSSTPPGQQILTNNHPGAFRSPLRDNHQLDTINEDRQWISNNPRFPVPRMAMTPEDSMDIISESHEVEKKHRLLANHAYVTCLNSNASYPSLLTNKSTHLLICSSTDLITTAITDYQQQQQPTNPNTNLFFKSNHVHLSPIGTTRC